MENPTSSFHDPHVEQSVFHLKTGGEANSRRWARPWPEIHYESQRCVRWLSAVESTQYHDVCIYLRYSISEGKRALHQPTQHQNSQCITAYWAGIVLPRAICMLPCFQWKCKESTRKYITFQPKLWDLLIQEMIPQKLGEGFIFLSIQPPSIGK